MLYITWCINGDKPRSHHDLDLFTLSMHDPSLNTAFGSIIMTLYIIDIIFSRFNVYSSLVAFIYIAAALWHLYFLVYEGRKTHKRIHEKENVHKGHVDLFTIFESCVVLIGGVSACWLYISHVTSADFESKFDAVSELFSWSFFMILQYISVVFIQLDYVYGRKLLMRNSVKKMLSFSALISAISITFLFTFEYAHFVESVVHIPDKQQDSSMDLTVSYALFWCLIEYFIWSFVTINHMLHHVHQVEDMDKFEAFQKRRMTLIEERKGTQDMDHIGIEDLADLEDMDKFEAFQKRRMTLIEERKGTQDMDHIGIEDLADL
eukprot:654785_1